MRNIKKIITLLLALIFVFSLTACSSGDLKDKLNGSSNQKSEYQKYVQGVMDCSYKGDVDNYVKVCEATITEAKECYDGATAYYAQALMYDLAISSSFISDGVLQKWNEYAKKAMKETDYTVEQANKVNDNWQVKVTIRPMNVVTDAVFEKIKAYYDEFVEKYKDVDFENISDEEYVPYMDEYAEGVLKILDDNFDAREYLDETYKIVEIKIDDKNYSVADSDWSDLDDMVVGFK